MNIEHTVSSLRHWNTRTDKEELFAFVHLVYAISVSRAPTISQTVTGIIGRRPVRTVPVSEYLYGQEMKATCQWVSGPITEEETIIIKEHKEFKEHNVL